MDTKVNYAAVGLFVIALVAAMIIGFVWLSGLGQQATYNTYLVYARGGVTGLNVDSPVQFYGVRVGSVHKIELDAINLQFVKLYLKIQSNIPITEGTVATLVPQGITGLVYVGLKEEGVKAPLLKTEKGQPYPIIPYEKPLLTQIAEALPDLAKNLREISEKFKKVFSDQNIASVSETLTHLGNITHALDEKSNTISQSLTSLDIFLKNSATASQRFNPTLMSIQKTATHLEGTSTQINNATQQITPSLQELLLHLNDASRNFQQVSEDLASNPAILIRGKQPSPPGPGE